MHISFPFLALPKFPKLQLSCADTSKKSQKSFEELDKIIKHQYHARPHYRPSIRWGTIASSVVNSRQSYVDDLFIIVRCTHDKTISDLRQFALNLIQCWYIVKELALNPSRTLLFSDMKRRKYELSASTSKWNRA